MGDIPKRLPCKTCSVKPKMTEWQLGYRDQTDAYSLKCPKCQVFAGGRTCETELECVTLWNAMQQSPQP